ncbi:MAG: sulfotransferase [Proteobacteria bacterium]|nr:sulfotransferase [Pseudomonadota bacterium]
MKRAFAAQHARRFGPGGAVENHVAFIDRLRTWFERQDMSGWSAVSSPVDSPVRQHVFLLGYLRSGVTLVESILASLSGTRVLEEADTLRVADSIFLRNDESLARLNPLDPVAAQHARDAYWKRVREKISDVDGKPFVDMSPLYGIKLPMIARLFPNAIWPSSVVAILATSCSVAFAGISKVNALTYQLTSLESIARHYDAAQSLTERHLQVLPMPRHFVEYSRLVRDFDGTTKALAEFIGADWTERVREFNSTAASLPVRHRVQCRFAKHYSMVVISGGDIVDKSNLSCRRCGHGWRNSATLTDVSVDTPMPRSVPGASG